MDRYTELTRRFWSMPLETTIHYAKATRTFVSVVTQRWALGRYVPSRCTPERLLDLTVQADLAAHVVACHLVALPDLDRPSVLPQGLHRRAN